MTRSKMQLIEDLILTGLIVFLTVIAILYGVYVARSAYRQYKASQARPETTQQVSLGNDIKVQCTPWKGSR